MMNAIIFVTLIAAANCNLLPQGFAPKYSPFQQQQHSVAQKAITYHQPAQYQVQSGPDATAQVLRSESIVNPESFQYAYETSNGIQGQEQGQLKQIGQESAITTQGQFGWTSPEGQPIQLSFVADENGYQPTGSHLPTPPPVPDAIARLVTYLQQHAPQQQQQQQHHQQLQHFGSSPFRSFSG